MPSISSSISSQAACFSLCDNKESTLNGENFFGNDFNDDGDDELVGKEFDAGNAIPIILLGDNGGCKSFSFILCLAVATDNFGFVGWIFTDEVLSKANEIKDFAEFECISLLLTSVDSFSKDLVGSNLLRSVFGGSDILVLSHFISSEFESAVVDGIVLEGELVDKSNII